METPRSLQNLIEYVQYVERTQRNERKFNMTAMAITPVEQIPLLIPNGFARMCSFVSGRGDDCTIRVQLQPGVYQNKILPFKENLIIEVCERTGVDQIMYRFRATPIDADNPEMEGTHTAQANLASKDETNLITIKFQLYETGLGVLRNLPAQDILLMSTLDNALHDKLCEAGESLGLTGPDAWKGVDIELPIDNDRVFKHIVIPFGTRLIDLGQFLQNHEEFGIYNTGLGMYYRKGLWRVYPLYRDGRYEKARRVLNIYRLPQNVFPTLNNTWIADDKSITIFSTGEAINSDNTDVKRQNKGVGKRIITSDAAMAETGAYYNKGVAVTTSQDSLSEYRTKARQSGEEWIPTEILPTGNICKHLSDNALNDINQTLVPWHNSNWEMIDPGMPVRYYYMSGAETLVFQEGSIGALRTEYQADTEALEPVFREHSTLVLLVNPDVYNVS